MKKKTYRHLDFFGENISIGDTFFYGNPCVCGIVVSKKRTSIVVEWFCSQWKEYRLMNIKDPSQGVSLTKVQLRNLDI